MASRDSSPFVIRCGDVGASRSRSTLCSFSAFSVAAFGRRIEAKLVNSERDEWVNLRRPARRDIGSNERRYAKSNSRNRDRRRIERGNTEQERANNAATRHRESKSDHHA